jgi:aspartyl-tRNA synthetase
MKNAKAIAYDLVLNGYEVAGGSIRINDIKIQKRLFKSLGLKEEEMNNKFGFLLNAFNYGVPPHGGIAFGLDRLVMILAKEKSIREVIAFPKNSKGYDPLISAPTIVSKDSLIEYKLKFK